MEVAGEEVEEQKMYNITRLAMNEPWMLWLDVALGALGLFMGVVQISGMKEKKSGD